MTGDSTGVISRRTFPARPSALTDVRAYVMDLVERASVPSEPAMDLVLAVSEACTNAVLHSGSLDLEIEWRSSEGRVVVLVRDRGVYLTGDAKRDRLPTGGLGLGLMHSTMDRVAVEQGGPSGTGTVVRLEKSIWDRVRSRSEGGPASGSAGATAFHR